MTILKHIASKNADYGKSLKYLMFQHDELTQKPILDSAGNMMLREEYYLDGINCHPSTFEAECEELNDKWKKNQDYNEIKSHHYIISFDPKDAIDRGLTGERAQQLGIEYAKKNFPGHQALVCTHMDGHNESSNIHVHIVINSLRKYDVERQDFMERDCDSRAGNKHHLTKNHLIHFEQIHYTGQYLANKSVYQQFCKAKNKGQFRQAHPTEIALYETARKFLKEHSADGRLPSMKLLKAEKAQLLQKKRNAGNLSLLPGLPKRITYHLFQCR